MSTLASLEKKIETNIKKAWYDNGITMYEIQQRGFYKKKYGTFKNYLESRWGYKESHGHQLINSSVLYQELESYSLRKKPEFAEFSKPKNKQILPKKESQVRELLSLKNLSEQVHVWANVVDTGKKITATLIKAEVDEFKTNPVHVEEVIAEPIIFDVKNTKQLFIEERKKQYTEATKRSIEDNKPVIHHIDCLDFMSTMQSDSIDMLITDPPYSTDIDDIESFARSWVLLALEKLKITGRAYICIGAYPIELQSYLNILLNEQTKFIVDNPLIWTYKNTLGVTPKNKYNLNYQVILHLYSPESRELDISITNEMFSVQEINAPDGRQGDRYHTWQKPDQLAMQLISHSTIENELIFDPFACTGTYLTCQSYFDGDKLLGGGIARTVDIFNAINLNNKKRTTNATFLIIRFKDIKNIKLF